MTEWPATLWGIEEDDTALTCLANGSLQECFAWGRRLPDSWRYEVSYEGNLPNGLLNELARRYMRGITGFLQPDLGDRYTINNPWTPWTPGTPDWRSGTWFSCRDCGDTDITDRVVHDRWHGDNLRVDAATRAILADRSARLGEICAALFDDVDESS